MHDAYAMPHITYCYVLTNVHEILAERSCRERQSAANARTDSDMCMYMHVYACICMHMYNMPSYIAPCYNTVHDADPNTQ